MEAKKYYISERFFTKDELKSFEQKHGYKVTEIHYMCIHGEIDFSEPKEKEFLMREGFPKILARFFA
ncbi:hypothetical protein [Capnocytophaga catalasegens]|uniref:Uncharacterized protein n=1 Tax=Capnocytophaga catalasegens TaxID=1004260 RepID=A0AAV5AYY3_9FLAO|nr:hypothetical protein [Capnocytophaga catalasegens]GIZ15292.1 hypothetical protein RCZ03_12920 [Capnocytophaga catalasegens]GJM51226.1 hypothetical protein RCZ15_21990 [Capnocytophaga catalasegens]GJM53020.1 hypothetical protein RCZ16_13370 [Capnocytophaga catalasegens]